MLSWSFVILLRLSIVLGSVAAVAAALLMGKAGKALRAWLVASRDRRRVRRVPPPPAGHALHS